MNLIKNRICMSPPNCNEYVERVGPGQDSHVALNLYFIINIIELPDLVIDKDELERSAHFEDRELSFLTCAMEENCVSSSAYLIPHEEYIFSSRRYVYT